MSKGKWVAVAVVAAFAVGYLVGREHLKYQIRNGVADVVQAFSKGISAAATGTARPAEEKQGAEDVVAATALVEAYKPYLKLYDVRAGYESDLLDGRVAVVWGKLKNSGTKTLSKVEVTAYFLDPTSTRIYEESYPAVLAGALSFSSDDSPLKPGYIRTFGFKATGCPKEWKAGAVECAITGIEFVDG